MAAGISLNRSRQVPAEDTPAFGGIAERFRRAGDLDRAVQLCRDGLKKFPDHLSARVTLGWSLLDLGKYDEARAELEQALKRAPDNLAAIRGLAELHDRAEHTMMLPMDGPGQWPPDADAIDALPASPKEDDFDFSLTPAAPAPQPPPVTEVKARAPEPKTADPVADLVRPAEPAEPPPVRRKIKAGKRASSPAAKGETAKVEDAAAVPAARAAEPVLSEPAIVLTNSAGMPLVAAAPAPEVTTPEKAESVSAPEPVVLAPEPVAIAPEPIAPPEPTAAPPVSPVEVETVQSAVASAMAEPINPKMVSLRNVAGGTPSTEGLLDDVFVSQDIAFQAISSEPPATAEAEAPPIASIESAFSSGVASASSDLELPADLSLEAVMRDFAPAEAQVTDALVLDAAEAAELNLDELVQELGASEPVVSAEPPAAVLATVEEASLAPAADVELVATPDADLRALLAESERLESQVAAVEEPAATVAPEPEAEDDPNRPVLVLTNPTPEDFPDPAAALSDLAAEAVALVSGDVAVNELPLLSAFVSETIEVDVAVARDDVPTGPFLELTNPTEEDFPEPTDLDGLAGDELVNGIERGAGEPPILAYLASLPDEPVAPAPVVMPVRTRSTRIPLERFLRQVQARRAQLMTESVA
jgi:hypothetical protein